MSPLVGSPPVYFVCQAAATLTLDPYLPPYHPPKLAVCLYWYRRLDRDPADIGLRGHIARAN